MKIDPNDKPITTFKDDRLGFDGLAEAITNQILSNEQSDGTVYAIYGCWGAGKSSLVNLVREKLLKMDIKSEYKESEFICWWLNDEEKIKSEFLDHLTEQIDTPLLEESKALLKKLSSRLVNATKNEVVNQAEKSHNLFGILSRVVMKTVTEESDEPKENYDTSDVIFKEIRDSLKRVTDRKYLIVIDDIDRMLPSQTIALFNLIKTIGRLPNFSYLVAYDRQIVEKLVYKKFPSEGPHFLEKIVQVGFEIPKPSMDLLQNELLEQLTNISTKFDYQHNYYFMKIFDLLVLPNIRTLRDLIRLISLVKNSWNVIGEYVNVADFLAIETLKVFQPDLFSKLRMHKLNLTEEYMIKKNNSFNQKFIETTKFANTNDNSDIIEDFTEGLKILFPNLRQILENKPTPGNHRLENKKNKIRGVRSLDNFDMYFNLQIPNTMYKSNFAYSLIDQCTCLTKVNEVIEYVSNLKEIHQHPLKIINFFKEVESLAEKIEPEGFCIILEGIFQNYSNLLKKYKKLNSEDKRDQLHNMVIKIFREMFRTRINEVDWSKLIYNQLVKSDLDCLIDFALFSYSQYEEKQQKIPNEFFVLTKGNSLELGSVTIDKIEEFVTNNQIYQCENFSKILFGWDKLAAKKNYTKARKFCAEKINDKNFVIKSAQSFITVRDKFSNSLELENVYHSSNFTISHYLEKDQVSKLLNVNKLFENAEKLLSDETCTGEERLILETFLNVQIISNRQ